ncbi:MAG: hypothetical protein Q8P24_08125 [Desulfobacterales bacterium]|nr:hypothetical protein [Desulfobacterales bacterium]
MQARYLLSEISFCILGSQLVMSARAKGMPAEFQALDFADVSNYSLAVRKGARHPNAAKLVGVFLASPAGAKFTVEESGEGNLYYPGNFEHDISMQNKKQGIREVHTTRDPKILEIYFTKDFERLRKEVKIVLDTGGKFLQSKKKKTK